MFRPALGRPALYPQDEDIAVVVSDAPRAPDAGQGVAWLDLNAPDQVLAWLRDWLRASPQVPVQAAVNG